MPSTLGCRNAIDQGVTSATTFNLITYKYRLPAGTANILNIVSGRPRVSKHSGNCRYRQLAWGIGIPSGDSQ